MPALLLSVVRRFTPFSRNPLDLDMDDLFEKWGQLQQASF